LFADSTVKNLPQPLFPREGFLAVTFVFSLINTDPEAACQGFPDFRQTGTWVPRSQAGVEMEFFRKIADRTELGTTLLYA
jgi:hypothetical protein